MRRILAVILQAALLLSPTAWADRYDDTAKLFKEAGQSAAFFDDCYGYAVFPTVGKGGFLVGGAHGSGRVYGKGTYVGDSSMTQLSIGLQAGGQVYSQIIFFADKGTFEDFTRGDFEFGADVSAVAVTAAVSASAGTSGAAAGVSGEKHDAATAGSYYKGMAVFTIAKGGAMYQAAVGGQKFSYRPKPDNRTGGVVPAYGTRGQLKGL